MQFKPVVQNPSLPRAIICDIDGTLAHMNGRSPYDYSKVGEDTLDETILWLISLIRNSGCMIIFVSGRDSECYSTTKDWIKSYYLGAYRLVMRKE
jgi:trehalose-6-phosphatase